MLAIYKRELKSYFQSFIGFLFIAVTLFFVSLYYIVYNLMSGYPYFSYAIANVVILFLIAIPVLCMRVLSEERKNKTDQLILTAPISVGDIVMGKFLALLTVFAIPTAIICLYPLSMRLFGSVKLMGVFKSLGVAENEQIEHKMLSSAIEKAQKKIEANNYGIRKNLLDYDQVNNEQREIIYKERRRVLDGENMRDSIYKMITDTVEHAVDMCFSDDVDQEEWNQEEFNSVLLPTIPLQPLTQEQVKSKKKNQLKQELKEAAVKLYEEKEAEFPEAEQLRELERVILLKVIDQKWMDHIDDMDQLRQGIGLQAYGQRDPKVEYKMQAYEMFDNMTTAIQETTIRLLYHVRIEQKVEREQVAQVTGTNKDESGPKKPVQREEKKVYPNDPCPCGSGKKYKQCCGRKKI